ncbi:MogA/MoaB family molybdenum cofactor biosynthesis protein [Ornithinibacillus contaminans]|uniref:MogA/MoaB family molybdenum cofactor biosynthesis protein n=1 Tax=Ornithinibacillus contaminans TaxID=694055 RepID=UPI00064DFDF5|nr:MogA/MoaB family molybdenum cofactor biosynthesis protein [Ornithinibacillus contaminans]
MLVEHRKNSARSVSCGVITVSDTRTIETDKSGQLMMEMLQGADHEIREYTIVPDIQSDIQTAVTAFTTNQEIEAVIINGGTGIAKRDITIEAIQPLFTKEISGFGELFRMLSYQFDIGPASMLSRAIAGIINERVVFATPGSKKAVQLAMEKLILPELGHAVSEVTKDLRKGNG